MYCIKLTNTTTNDTMYWSHQGSIRTMDSDKAMYIHMRLTMDMYGTSWTVEVVPVEQALAVG